MSSLRWSMKPTSHHLLPILCLLIAMLSISTGAALAKGLFPVLGVPGTNAVRFVVAALIMMIVLRGWRARITRDNWPSLTIYGVTLCGMNLSFYMALKTLPLGIASAIEFMGPLTVSILYSNSRKDYFWAALAAAGLLLLMPITGAGAGAGLDPFGMMWAVSSAVCWALYIVFGLRAGKHHGAQTPALGMVVAALIALPFGAVEASEVVLRVDIIPLIFIVALLSSAIPISLEMFSLQRLPTRTFGVLLSIEPAIGALVGFVFLTEALASQQILAIGLVVMACAGASYSARPRADLPRSDLPRQD